MKRWIWLLALPSISLGVNFQVIPSTAHFEVGFIQVSTSPISFSTTPIPSDIHIDKDIQEWQRGKALWDPNMYELQILREIQKLNKAQEQKRRYTGSVNGSTVTRINEIDPIILPFHPKVIVCGQDDCPQAR